MTATMRWCFGKAATWEMDKLSFKDALLFSAWFGTPIVQNNLLVTPFV